MMDVHARIREMAMELAELIDGLPSPTRGDRNSVLPSKASVTFSGAMSEARHEIMAHRFPAPEMPLPDMDNPAAVEALFELVRAGDVETIDRYLEDIYRQNAIWHAIAKQMAGLRRIAKSNATRQPPLNWSDRYSPDDPHWVDVATVADRYSLSPGAVREHCKKHKIGEWQGGVWRVSIDRAKQLYNSDRVRRR